MDGEVPDPRASTVWLVIYDLSEQNWWTAWCASKHWLQL